MYNTAELIQLFDIDCADDNAYDAMNLIDTSVDVDRCVPDRDEEVDCWLSNTATGHDRRCVCLECEDTNS